MTGIGGAGIRAGMDTTHSPYHQHLGITVEEWREGYARLVCETAPFHANRSGIVHGGLLLSMIDQAAAFAGLYCATPGRVRRAVTLDLDCRFTGQAAIGGRLVAEGRVVTGGRNVFFARTEVFDAEGRMVAFGASTHRYRAGSGDPEGVPIQP
ncbi:PaaI family thioesterase [Belnapia moabensis]|uniref:PaaI family thioesterase n=1 Tax=Belnapia moabensis TaxID=365533 RepID=UPI001FE193A0|nr:PaaI family thioesterase [Belnapia moabensis]